MDTPAVDARRRGYDAARAGLPQSTNPYDHDEMLSLEWRKGFGIGVNENSVRPFEARNT